MSADSISQKTVILQEHQFFRNLPPRIVQQLSARARQTHYPAGRQIFAKGDEGHGLLAVLSGTVKISCLSKEGREIVLNLVRSGDIFGEIALLDGEARTADATAVTDCDLVVLDRRDFLQILMDEPVMAVKLLEVVSQRLRRTSEQVEDLSFGDPPSSIAKALLRLAEVQGTIADQQPRVAITQKELGNVVGLSRERTNWYLRDWEDAGYLTLEKGACVIKNTRRLAELAGKSSTTTSERASERADKPHDFR